MFVPDSAPAVVVFDLAAQLVNAAFGPDDHPLQVTLKFNPNPHIALDTLNGHSLTIRAFPTPEADG